jgi:hypothetical protein
MVGAKIALIIIIGVIALFSGIMGFLSDYTNIDDQIRSAVKSPTGFFLSLKEEQRTVSFTANLFSDKTQSIPLSFTTSPQLIDLSFTDPKTDFKVNGLSMSSPGKNHVLLYGYKGKATIREKLTLDGSVKEANVNSVEINMHERRITIDTIELNFDSVEFIDLPETSLQLINMTGTINANGESYDITYKIDDQNLEIKSFRGNMKISDDSVILEGKGTIKTEALSTPGI